MSKVLARQSLLDIAIQNHGTREDVLNICQDNDISLTDDLTAATDINVGSKKNKTTQLYAVNGIKPATAVTEMELSEEITADIRVFDDSFDATYN